MSTSVLPFNKIFETLNRPKHTDDFGWQDNCFGILRRSEFGDGFNLPLADFKVHSRLALVVTTKTGTVEKLVWVT